MNGSWTELTSDISPHIRSRPPFGAFTPATRRNAQKRVSASAAPLAAGQNITAQRPKTP